MVWAVLEERKYDDMLDDLLRQGIRKTYATHPDESENNPHSCKSSSDEENDP